MAESTYRSEDLLPPLDALLLAPRPAWHGPVTRRLLRRSVLGLALLFWVGVALVGLSDAPAARAAGLSMIFPGGGSCWWDGRRWC